MPAHCNLGKSKHRESAAWGGKSAQPLAYACSSGSSAMMAAMRRASSRRLLERVVVRSARTATFLAPTDAKPGQNGSCDGAERDRNTFDRRELTAERIEPLAPSLRADVYRYFLSIAFNTEAPFLVAVENNGVKRDFQSLVALLFRCDIPSPNCGEALCNGLLFRRGGIQF